MRAFRKRGEGEAIDATPLALHLVSIAVVVVVVKQRPPPSPLPRGGAPPSLPPFNMRYVRPSVRDDPVVVDDDVSCSRVLLCPRRMQTWSPYSSSYLRAQKGPVLSV